MPFCHGLAGAVMTCSMLRLASFSAIHSIAITDQVTRRIPVGDGLNQSLSSPFRCGVLGDVEVNNFGTPVSENHDDKQHFESKRRPGKKSMAMISVLWFFRNVFQFMAGAARHAPLSPLLAHATSDCVSSKARHPHGNYHSREQPCFEKPKGCLCISEIVSY
jgi:hypothetical protein